VTVVFSFRCDADECASSTPSHPDNPMMPGTVGWVATQETLGDTLRTLHFCGWPCLLRHGRIKPPEQGQI